MNEAYETFEHAGLMVSLYPDADPGNPREENDCYLGEMICWHRGYNLGDYTLAKQWDHRDYSGWDALEAAVVGKHDIALPLYLYDHSGLRMKVGSFRGLLPQGHAEFDSGQVGWIVARAAKIRAEFGVGWHRDPTKQRELERKVEERLAAEVEEYDQYLSGDVWGYIIRERGDGQDDDEDGDGEVLDSCWGFYGLKYCQQEAREAAEACAKQKVETLTKTYVI